MERLLVTVSLMITLQKGQPERPASMYGLPVFVRRRFKLMAKSHAC